MRNWAGPLCLFLAFSLAGTSVVAARVVSGKLGVFTISSVSLLFALLVLIPACKRSLFRFLRMLTAKQLGTFALQAVFGIFLFRLFLLSGLARTSAVEAGILTGATPAITALAARLLLRERAGVGRIAGILATVSGVAMIQGLTSNAAGFSVTHLGGNLLVLCAAASESSFNILSRIAAVEVGGERSGEPGPLVQTALVSLGAFLLCLIPALREQPIRRLAALSLEGWLALTWYGVFVTAFAFIAWYAGIRRCGALTAAAFSGMMPFTSMLLSVVLLREDADWRQWLGGALVMLGMFLIGAVKGTKKVPMEENIERAGNTHGNT